LADVVYAGIWPYLVSDWLSDGNFLAQVDEKIGPVRINYAAISCNSSEICLESSHFSMPML
jgi:hypothetical protein